MDNNFDVAVIGMSCRFPGANNLDEFWSNLSKGKESISFFTDEEIKKSGISPSLLNNPQYVKASPVIDNHDRFDAAFFGYTKTEAEIMDPQHRLMIQCAYEALEDAGYASGNYKGRVGVFTGAAMNTYFMYNIAKYRFSEEYIPVLINNDKDFLSTKVSYKLNLKGPSINVQTACSTSVVAIHLACQSLITGESDMTLAGAVSVKVPHISGYIADRGGVVSPDAHVRAFDAEANGTVFGSGCGVVILKRLPDAVEDGDNIYAVIKGTAVNNDGSEKAGYTAPGINSQAEVIAEAITISDIDADSITLIEAHGSGTPLGDSVEAAALTKAFRKTSHRKNFCALGSVKTNIGHLDAAAGIAGFIKTVLSLKYKKLLPSINFNRPNPELNIAESPFYINSRYCEWESNSIRRAGVVSTGMGGTNTCVILEEFTENNPNAHSSNSPALLLFSAKTEESLKEGIHKFNSYISKNDISLGDAAYTLMNRQTLPFKKYFVAQSKTEAVSLTKNFIEKSEKQLKAECPVVFLIPGIGDHYPGMAYDLYKSSTVFREEVDNCVHIINKLTGHKILELLYPESIRNKSSETTGLDLKAMLFGKGAEPPDPDTERLNQTINIQPALFTLEYAIAKLWINKGIIPAALAGHSMGEYVAACLSGVLSLEDALKLIVLRARMVDRLDKGGMLAVTLTEEELTPLLTDGVSLALINSPDLCIAAGLEEDLIKFEATLKSKNIIYRRVQNSHAFHSKLMMPVYNEYLELVRRVKLNPPSIPYLSNVTGTWITPEQCTDPEYWAEHLIKTARFSDALDQVWQVNNCILLEIGPGNTLGFLALKHPRAKTIKDPVSIPSVRAKYDKQNDELYFLNAAGRLWMNGFQFDRKKFFNDIAVKHVHLPPYAFQKERYWIDPVPEAGTRTQSVELEKDNDINNWFYTRVWKRTIPSQLFLYESDSVTVNDTWLVFEEKEGFAEITEKLKSSGARVIRVIPDDKIYLNGNDIYSIIPGNKSAYNALISKLKAENKLPNKIIYAWNINNETEKKTDFSETQNKGFFSLTYLSAALSINNIRNNIDLFVISTGIYDVTGNEIITPDKSTLIGASLVIPQEYPNIKVRIIDFDNTDFHLNHIKYNRLLIQELLNPQNEFISAFRSGNKWILSYEKVSLPAANGLLKQGGIYLITGGLGDVCFTMAKYLASKYKANLIITGTTPLSDKYAGEDINNNKLSLLRQLESYGSEVKYFCADASDVTEMKNVIDYIFINYKKLNGVIHGAGLVGEKGFCTISEMDPAKAELHFKPKVTALYVLNEILAGMEIDFCMLMSSLTPILGGLRESAYSSSNIFMDSYAVTQNRKGLNWISVNWDLWRINNSKKKDARSGKTLAQLGISEQEGIQVLERILSLKGVSGIIVSTGDLQARLNQWVNLEPLTEPDSPEPVDLNTGEINVFKSLSEIWINVLGIENIQASDNFFEAGGHSLLAIQLISAVRKKFMIDIGLDDVFNFPVFMQMSGRIQELLKRRVNQVVEENS